MVLTEKETRILQHLDGQLDLGEAPSGYNCIFLSSYGYITSEWPHALTDKGRSYLKGQR